MWAKRLPIVLWAQEKQNVYLGKLPSNCFPYCKERSHLHKKPSSWKPAKILCWELILWPVPKGEVLFSPAPPGWPFHAVPTISGGNGAVAQVAPALCSSQELPLPFLTVLTVLPGILFSFCSHIIFSSHRVPHTLQSAASAANLWSCVTWFADFLPKVTICSTTMQRELQIVTHGSSPQLLNGINSLHNNLAQEEKLQKSLHHFTCCSIPGL